MKQLPAELRGEEVDALRRLLHQLLALFVSTRHPDRRLVADLIRECAAIVAGSKPPEPGA